MVARSLKYLGVALIALTLTAVLGVTWLLGSRAGARTALQLLDRFTPLEVTAEGVEGRLAGDLELQNLRLAWADGHWQTERLQLSWRPGRLLAGQLAIDALQLSGVRLQLPPRAEPPEPEPQPAQPLSIAWPKLSGWLLRVAAQIDRFQVDDFQLRRGQEPAQIYPHLQLGARWQQGQLALSELQAQTPFGELRGDLSAGFATPQLKADLLARWPGRGPIMDGLKLELELDPQASAEELSGQLRLATLLGDAEQAFLQSRFHLGPHKLELSELELERSSAPDRVSGSLALELAERPPSMVLELVIEKLNLGPETGYQSALSGTLALSGHAQGYRGHADLRNLGEGWRQHALAADITGNLKGLQLENVRGKFMDGELRGQARMDWSQGFALQAELQGRRLDPSQLTPDWPGLLNLDVAGSLSVGAGQPLAIDVRGKFLDSTLRGRELKGVVDGLWRGPELILRQLELRGEGIDLSAKGQLSRKIDFSVQIPRLGGVVPGAAGELASQGWLSWSPGRPAGELSLQAKGLSFEDHQLAQLDLQAAQSAPDLPMTLQLQARGLSSGRYRLDRSRLQLDGWPHDHSLSLDLTWPQGNAHLGAKGGYADGIWQGRLAEFLARDQQIGDWRLQEAVQLTVSAKRLQFSPLALEGRQQERLQLQGDLTFAPLLGEVSGDWKDLDLGHLQPWLGQLQLTGRSSGSLGMQWRRDGRRELHGALDLSGRLSHGELAVGLRRVEGELDWTDQGLLGLWDINLDGGGIVTGRISAPDPMAAGLPRGGDFYLDWTKLNLELLQPILADWELTGNSEGDLSGSWWDDGRLQLRGEASASGRLAREEQVLEVKGTALDFAWGQAGLQAKLNLTLTDGGKLKVSANSSEPARQGLPGQGEFSLDWEGLDLALLRPWLPEGLRLDGALSGMATGQWLPEQRLSLNGQSSIKQGQLEWRDEDGIVVAPLRTADLHWAWEQQRLNGGLELVLADYGRLAGTFDLPLPARFPVKLDPQGPVRLDLTAKLREKGVLTSVFPGLVQESRGQLEADLHAAGSWEQPEFSGRLQLNQAGAYLHAAGIHLRDLELTAHLQGDEVILDRFGVRSGKGQLEGDGRLTLRNWKLAGYSGTLRGENFLAVNLPELQLHLSPDLAFSGDTRKLKVRGELTVPEMLVQGRQTPSPVRPSADVVVVDAAAPTVGELPLELDAVIQVSLGERVLIKVSGVDARLGGKATLTMSSLSNITSQGEIKVVQGTYAAYGVKLNITRGSLLFAGGPVDRPTLDLLALRTVGDTKAGIQISGTPRRPQVKLYSEPALPDTDILAYMVLGRPLDQQGGQTDLLMLAAGGLLSKGDSAVLQDKLKNTLGLDVIDVQAGGGDVAGSMITIGKYLTPDLFISFGQSLFTNTSQARLRYTISRRWELESVVGEESGVDLYYKIEFE